MYFALFFPIAFSLLSHPPSQIFFALYFIDGKLQKSKGNNERLNDMAMPHIPNGAKNLPQVFDLQHPVIFLLHHNWLFRAVAFEGKKTTVESVWPDLTLTLK